MDELLTALIYKHFNYVKAADIIKADDLLRRYDYDRHREYLNDMLGTDITDDADTVSNRILEVYEEAIWDVLVNMFIVPTTTNFNDVLLLLTNMYYLENYFEHQVLIDEIEDLDYLNSPRETLLTLLEKLADQDWGVMSEIVGEVRKSLITALYNLHKKLASDGVEAEEPLLMQERGAQTKAFFTRHPNSIVGQFVAQGLLPVPVELEQALATVTKTIYDLNDPEQLALEIVATAYLTPIKLASVATQARVILNKLYADIGQISTIGLAIDKIIADEDTQNKHEVLANDQ